MDEIFWVTPEYAPSGQGLTWPEPGSDPATWELVAYEAEADGWNGDELLECMPPWLLATIELIRSIESAELIGLRVGMPATLSYSREGAIRASLGEYVTKTAPDFRLVRADQAADLGPEAGPFEDGIELGRDPLYVDWSGGDFAYPSEWGGLLVTERALATLRKHRLDNCGIWPVNRRR